MPDAAPVTTATRPERSKAASASGFTVGALPWMDCVTRRAAADQGVAEAGDLLPRQLLGQPHHRERQRHGPVGPEHRGRDLAQSVGGTLLELLEEVLLVGEVLHRHRQGPAPAVAARQGPAQLQVGDGLEVEGVAPPADDRQGRAQPLLVVERGPRSQAVQPLLDGVGPRPGQEDGPEGRGQRDALAHGEGEPHRPGPSRRGQEHHLVADRARGHHLGARGGRRAPPSRAGRGRRGRAGGPRRRARRR